MTVADARARLKGVRPCAGGLVACCPAHDDHHPSLHAFRFPSASPMLVSTWRSTRASAPGDAERTGSAARAWRAAKAATGTLVETYLCTRAITVAIPPSLRFNGGLKHPSDIYLPVMVAAVQNGTARLSQSIAPS